MTFPAKPWRSHTDLYKFKPQTVVTQDHHMLQGESHVSRGPILLLGNSICPMSRFAERSNKSKKKKTQYNSSYCELGPPVPQSALNVSFF